MSVQQTAQRGYVFSRGARQSRGRRPESSRGAFTLIEILVVVAIISLLISLLLPSLSAARQHTRKVVCGSNLHAWASAVQTYAASFSGYIPRDYGYTQGLYVALGDRWHVCAPEVLSPYLGGPKLPLVPRDQDPFVIKKPENLTGADSVRDEFLAPVFRKIGVLQCPSFPTGQEPVTVHGQVISEQPFDYLINAFTIGKGKLGDDDGGGEGLTRIERIPMPGRLIYVTEVNRRNNLDYFGRHDVFSANALWSGNQPRMIDDDRHPVFASRSVILDDGPSVLGATNALFFDGHVESPMIHTIKVSRFTPYE